jgi:hypothetical protein
MSMIFCQYNLGRCEVENVERRAWDKKDKEMQSRSRQWQCPTQKGLHEEN